MHTNSLRRWYRNPRPQPRNLVDLVSLIELSQSCIFSTAYLGLQSGLGVSIISSVVRLRIQGVPGRAGVGGAARGGGGRRSEGWPAHPDSVEVRRRRPGAGWAGPRGPARAPRDGDAHPGLRHPPLGPGDGAKAGLWSLGPSPGEGSPSATSA